MSLVRVELSPIEGQPGHLLRFRITADQDAEVVFDRRLLSFTEHLAEPTTPRRRGARAAKPRQCAHPDRPREAERARTLSAGQSLEEWIDLRYYCFTQPELLNATLDAHYGFAVVGRRRAVRNAKLSIARTANGLQGEADAGTVGPACGASSCDGVGVPEILGEDDRATASPINVRFARTSAASIGSLELLLERTSEDAIAEVVYFRPDEVRFEVRKNGISVQCDRRQSSPVVPIVDFYETLSRRPRHELYVPLYCPGEIFDDAGIYEVRATVNLPYDGERFGLDAFVGRVRGTWSLVRVLGPDDEAHELSQLSH